MEEARKEKYPQIFVLLLESEWDCVCMFVVTGSEDQTHFLGFEVWTAAELCSGRSEGFACSAQELGSVTAHHTKSTADLFPCIPLFISDLLCARNSSGSQRVGQHLAFCFCFSERISVNDSCTEHFVLLSICEFIPLAGIFLFLPTGKTPEQLQLPKNPAVIWA